MALAGILALSLLVAACGEALSTEDIASQGEVLELATGSIREMADAAEDEAPYLDIVEVQVVEEDKLIVFVLLDSSAEEEAVSSEEVLQLSVEAIWRSTLEHMPEIADISVAFMRLVEIRTLDKGLAKGAYVEGTLLASMADVASYLAGPMTTEDRSAFWNGGPLQSIPIQQGYSGTPNHLIWAAK